MLEMFVDLHCERTISMGWAPGESFEFPLCSSLNVSSFLAMQEECGSQVGFQDGNWTCSRDEIFERDKNVSLPTAEVTFIWDPPMRLFLPPLFIPRGQTELEAAITPERKGVRGCRWVCLFVSKELLILRLVFGARNPLCPSTRTKVPSKFCFVLF